MGQLSLRVRNGPTARNKLPASETTTANISCALPVTMSVRPVIGQLPDCPLLSQANQNIQFPVRSGKPLSLEVNLYDEESRQFDNFTSLQWSWKSSDNTALPTPSASSLEQTSSGAILSVVLGGQTGSVVLTASTNSYNNKYLSQEGIAARKPFSPGVSYSLTLLLREEPELLPSELLLFNHPENTGALTIKHGSGHFRLNHMTNNRLPALANFDPEAGKITLAPAFDGVMKLSVVDLCLETDTVTQSVITVAGVYAIEVEVTNKLQLGNSTVAFVRVLDNRQRPFPSQQLRFMNLMANPRSSHITVAPASNQILSSLSRDQTSHSAVYEVGGASVGVAQLVFNATTNGRVIRSPPREIQVFDALQLLPEHITLLPSATFQIASSGGPMPHCTIVYSVSDSSIASVDDSGLISAIKPGDTVVTGQAQALDSNTGQMVTYSQDIVYVHVVKLTGIKLFVPSKRLLSDEEIAIYVQGLKDETPFTFASAVPGLSFQWSSSNMDVASLTSMYDKAGVSLQEEQDFTAMLNTRHPGQAAISISAKCSAGICIPEGATFTDQAQVRVVPPLQLLRPLGGHFLLPHNGEARIVTNRDGVCAINYNMLDRDFVNGVIRLGGAGEVSTGSGNGHAVVMVTANDHQIGLNQTAVVHIEVQPIASISIVPLSVAQATPNSKVHAFPLGYSAEFIAYLHDNIGRRFNFADIPLTHRLSRSDIVQVSPEAGNSTFTIKASKQGEAILKIWVSSQPHISDYIRIRVGYAILPSLATVHLGTLICFSTHLTEETEGSWSVGHDGVINMEQESGVGRAVSTGRTVVYHSGKDTVDTHTEITVSKVERVIFSVQQTSLQTFTNAARKPELGVYSIPVEFYYANDEKFTALHTSPTCQNTGPFIQQVPFECELELKEKGNNQPLLASKYIKSEPFFNTESAKSYCILSPAANTYAAESLASMEGLTLTLKVRAFDSFETYESFSSSLPIPFVSAFVLSRDKIKLGDGETFTDVKVTGSVQQLQAIKVSSPHPISVTKIRSISLTEDLYRISLTDPTTTETSVNITFSSKLAHQETNIQVNIVPQDDQDGSCIEPAVTAAPQTLASSYELPIEYKYIVVIVITIFAVLVATFVICMALKQTTSKPKSGFAAHLPPKGTPLAAFAPSTPHTPYQQTPAHMPRSPPLTGGSSVGGSAFKRPPGYSPSPQHGLFSQ